MKFIDFIKKHPEESCNEYLRRIKGVVAIYKAISKDKPIATKIHDAIQEYNVSADAEAITNWITTKDGHVTLAETKAEIRQQRIKEIDVEIGGELDNLMSSLGITKSLTGEQRDKLIPVIAKITKLLAEKLILKGQDLKDAVIEYLKYRKIPIDKDVEGIVQDNVDKLVQQPQEETKEETVPSSGEEGKTAGIAAEVQQKKAILESIETSVRGHGVMVHDAANLGRRLLELIPKKDQEAYINKMKDDYLNERDPLKRKSSLEKAFLACAWSAKLEGDYNELTYEASQAKGVKKRELQYKAKSVLKKWQSWFGEVINPIINEWSVKGTGFRGKEDIQTGTLTAFALYQMKVNKRPFTDKQVKHFAKTAYDLWLLTEQDKKFEKKFADMIRGGYKEPKRKTISVSLNDIADKLADLRKKIHKSGEM